MHPQRVRLADASLPAERDIGVAASAFTLNDEDKRAIAAVLQEQRKGLEFLRNTLQTDVRHVQLMLEHVSPGGSATVTYARGSTVHSMLSQGGNGAALGVAGVDSAFGTNSGSIDPLHGGGSGMSAFGLHPGSGVASVGAGGPSPHWGGGGAHGMVAYLLNSCPWVCQHRGRSVHGCFLTASSMHCRSVVGGIHPGMQYGAYGAYGVAPGGMGMGGMPMGVPHGAPVAMQAASPFANAQIGAASIQGMGPGYGWYKY